MDRKGQSSVLLARIHRAVYSAFDFGRLKACPVISFKECNLSCRHVHFVDSEFIDVIPSGEEDWKESARAKLDEAQ
jgi:hypothetical protein